MKSTRDAFMDLIQIAPAEHQQRLIDLLDSVVFQDELDALEDRVEELEP